MILSPKVQRAWRIVKRTTQRAFAEQTPNKCLDPNRSTLPSRGMARRSSNGFREAELAYPIRVKLVVPPRGLQGLGDRLQAWLNAELTPSAWSWGPARSRGCQSTAYYFRTLEDAQKALAAFPELQLADTVRVKSHSSELDREGDRNFSAGPGWESEAT